MPGADTKYYNDMEMLERNLKTRTHYENDEERTLRYHQAFAEVRMYVRKAIEVALSNRRFFVNDEDRTVLSGFVRQLNHRMYDRTVLDQIIDEAETILLKYVKDN